MSQGLFVCLFVSPGSCFGLEFLRQLFLYSLKLFSFLWFHASSEIPSRGDECNSYWYESSIKMSPSEEEKFWSEVSQWVSSRLSIARWLYRSLHIWRSRSWMLVSGTAGSQKKHDYCVRIWISISGKEEEVEQKDKVLVQQKENRVNQSHSILACFPCYRRPVL